jgi:hypothetical protein
VDIMVDGNAEKIAMYKKQKNDIEKAVEERSLQILRDNFFIEQVTTIDKTE